MVKSPFFSKQIEVAAFAFQLLADPAGVFSATGKRTHDAVDSGVTVDSRHSPFGQPSIPTPTRHRPLLGKYGSSDFVLYILGGLATR